MDEFATDRARRAYHAYGSITRWRNFRGEPMPAWHDLGPAIQSAWVAAATAAATFPGRQYVDPFGDLFARIAYQAYGHASDWTSHGGEPMKAWIDLPPAV